MTKTTPIKGSTNLGMKVKNYIEWKYSGKRSLVYIGMTFEGYIRVTTRCHKKDHYPTPVRNTYRRRTVNTEYVNQYQMAECWKYNK